ncbi:MAG: aliphatic sulfonate ABC transporter substrate-binding protein [Eubacterium sp.]|nr:aliphatic sulfonate ABC transporter substrate-binding protein [Eubacterium sp.]
MKCFNRRLLFISTALILLSVCAACSQEQTSGDSKTDVRIAYFPNITHTQALVLKNQGTLELAWEDSCDVTWTSFNAGPSEIEAIFAGEIDIGYIGPVPALNANIKSAGDVKIIANATNAGAVLLVRKDSGIASIPDLAGKKIAVPQLANTQHLCLLSILSANNMKTTDQGGSVTINASSNADIVNLMDNGSIDAAVVPEPWGTIMEKSGNAEILLDYNELFWDGNYPAALVVANGDFIKEHPQLVQEFLEMHESTTSFINQNPSAAQEIVNTEIENATGKPIDAAVMESAFSRMEATTELNIDAILSFAAIGREEGFNSMIPEESDVFDTEFRP